MKTLGERLEAARICAKINKAELGRIVGVSKAAIGQLENGTSKAPTPENLFKLSKALNINAEWLATGVGEMNADTNKACITKEGEEIAIMYQSLSDAPKTMVRSLIDSYQTDAKQRDD